jgi:hypothetical protein
MIHIYILSLCALRTYTSAVSVLLKREVYLSFDVASNESCYAYVEEIHT